MTPALSSFFHRVSEKISSTLSHANGFTLIEMLIAISVMSLLVGGSIAGYNKYNTRQIVIQDGKILASTLRTAQTRARVGDKPTAGCTKLDGYRVIGTANASTYELRVVCDGADAGTISTITLTTGVIIQQSFNFLFPILSSGVVGAVGAGTNVVVQNNVVSGGYRYTVSVSSSGVVYETGITSF